ncbi:hypothetical protein AB3X96_39855 [Paraburkholderia sp. BR13439]|uniref:hypothetical protein n=1 Tax=Paraburkholderia TaxID=1822464 RepID=UPI0034CE2D14
MTVTRGELGRRAWAAFDGWLAAKEKLSGSKRAALNAFNKWVGNNDKNVRYLRYDVVFVFESNPLLRGRPF